MASIERHERPVRENTQSLYKSDQLLRRTINKVAALRNTLYGTGGDEMEVGEDGIDASQGYLHDLASAVDGIANLAVNLDNEISALRASILGEEIDSDNAEEVPGPASKRVFKTKEVKHG